jgi:hypothetical protein
MNMNELTNSQQKWLNIHSSFKNTTIIFDHFTPNGKAIFSVEDNNKWATAVVGKKGHWEYINVLMKVI